MRKGLKMKTEIEKMIYAKYGKMNLNIKEMSEVIGISVSKSTKIFSEKGEKEILKFQILPAWRKIGGTRLWPISTILNWNENMEKVA